MRSSLGCLTMVGAATAISLATGLENQALATCHATGSPGLSDNVSNYATACTLASGTYGAGGVCLASIAAAITCAKQTLTSIAGGTLAYTLTVGSGTNSSPLYIDLSHDLSRNPAPSAYPTTPTFDIEGSGTFTQSTIALCTTSSKAGCLTIRGNGGTGSTVIKTADGPHEVRISNWSHVIFQDLTFTTPMELMDQGTHAVGGTTTITAFGTTLSFATVTLDIIPQTNVPQIQNVQNFATLTQDSYSIKFSPAPATLPVDLLTTSIAGGTCSSDATILLSINNDGKPTGITGISAPAVCTTYPTSPEPVTTTTCGMIGSLTACAAFFVAYTPTPMAQWINAFNTFHVNGNGFQNFAKAYTISNSPVSVSSSITSMTTGNFIQNSTTWGSPFFGTTTTGSAMIVATPPTQSATNANEWTLTLSGPLEKNNVLPPYWEDPTHYVCLHHDDQTVVEVNNLSDGNNGGSDVIFDHVNWQDMSRAAFLGTPQSQVTNSAISRDTLAYAGQTIVSGSTTYNVTPCYSSVNGGPQFSSASGPATYGNTINNFTTDATADTPVMVANDVGGVSITNTAICGSTLCAQSNLSNSSLRNSEAWPVILLNEASVTGITNESSGNYDTGSCPTYTITGTATGSPVCVDSNTQTLIESAPANCDTYTLGLGCPVWYRSY